MIIAVDGPAASGKGTIARALAAHYRLPHLDTGLLYRAVGVALARVGGDADDEDAAERACDFPDSLMDDPELRGAEAGSLASRVARHPRVRAALLARQQAFARQPGGAVLDGRDIGTVIAPEADAKLFVTASIEARTDRRYRELSRKGGRVDRVELREDLVRRDERDSSRDAAPLLQSASAGLLDTTNLNVDQAIAAAIAMVERQRLAG